MIEHTPDQPLIRDPDHTSVRIPVAWGALEDAFENNAPEVHSYLQVATGEVIRVVDGIADPVMHARISADPGYLRIDPVASREQYRWMERFIAAVEDDDFRRKLLASIDGKGAFRRFKDVLMTSAVERERWFVFRSERLRGCMEAWLEAHGIEALPRAEWQPTEDGASEAPAAELSTAAPLPRVAAEPVVVHRPQLGAASASAAQAAVSTIDLARERLRGLVEALPARDVEQATSYLEFLRDRNRAVQGATRVGARAASRSAADDDVELRRHSSSDAPPAAE